MGAGCCRAQSDEPAIAFSSVTGGDNDIPSSRSERELSLLDAAERGDDRHIQKLVQAGVDVNVRGTRFLKEGETPLMQAAQEGKTSTCTVLLDRGAEIEARDAFGKTALMLAARAGETSTCTVLLDRGAEIEAMDYTGRTALMQAAQEGKTSTCTVLLDQGAEIEARDEYGYTPLMYAAMAGQTSTCTVLLDRGAEIQARNEEGETPLMKAAYWGNTSTLSVLLDRGAEIQARDKDQGQTALHHAVDCDFEIEDNLPVIKVLWERGSNLDLKDTKGKTPLAYAVEMNKTEVMLFLIDKGADVSAINQHKELYNKVIKRGLTQHILDQNADLDFSGAKLSSAKMQKLISIKVVLLGDVCAGKSSLMETLIKGTSSLTNIEDRTVGINVRKYIMQNDLHITFYDFGGHRTYYFLHQLFLTPSALFNLLVDLSTFDKNDLAASIKHWYFSISSHVVCPIILVIGSKADKCSKEKTEENCSFIINALKDIEHEENERLQESLDMKENALRELKEILPGIDESNLQTSMEVCLKKKTKSNEENTRHRIKEIFDKLPGINAGNIMDKRDALKEMIANRPYIHNTVARISCSTMEGIPELIETIKQLIRDRPKQFPVQEVPATWVEMTDVLEKKAKKKKVPTATLR